MQRRKDVDPCANYPIQIHYIKEDDAPGYFFAFHPDFGASACSATGDTIPQAIMLLGKVRTEVLCYLRSSGKPIPEPSANPLDANKIKRCFLNCAYAGPLIEAYGTAKCELLDRYHKVGSPCPRPLEAHSRTAIDNHWVCVHQCEKATVLEYKNPQATFIKCGKDAHQRLAGVTCPHPQSVRQLKGKLDPVTKYYLRAIRAESKKITTTHTLDMVDELVAKALRLQETVSPVHRKHYGVIDSTNYATRIAALALRLLTRNFYNKATRKS